MENIANDIDIISRIPAVSTILDVVCRTTGMGFAAVARVTECRWVACSVVDHIHFGLTAGGELELDTTICNEIRHHRNPVVIDNVAEDDFYRDHQTPLKYGFQSYISMPIVLANGRFFGTLCAIDPNPTVLKTPAITGMFTLFAELIAFHIDAAERLAVSESDLRKEREDAVLREQFIAVLGHDLRSPLAAIRMGVDLLKENTLEGPMVPLVGMMGEATSRMFALIGDIMDFARGRLGGGIAIYTSAVSLEPLLDQLIGEVQARWPDRGIDTCFSLAEPVHCDPERLSQLVTNLLVNAMTHGKPGRRVLVQARSADGRFDLTVSNAADPIPLMILERLFEPFSRGDSVRRQQGLGLGLYIASQIAKSHGGTLEATSSEQETKLSLSMPSGASE